MVSGDPPPGLEEVKGQDEIDHDEVTKQSSKRKRNDESGVSYLHKPF